MSDDVPAAKALSARLARDTLLVTALALVAKATGILVPIFIASRFGVSPETDAYFLAVAIPLSVVAIISGAARSGMVPVFSRLLMRSKSELQRVSGELLGVAMLGGLALGLLLVAAPLFLRQQVDPSAESIRWLTPLILVPLPCLALGAALIIASLDSAHRFASGATIPLVRAFTFLAVAWAMAPLIEVAALPVALVAQEVIGLIVLAWRARRESLMPSIRFRLSPESRQALRSAGNLAVGSAAVGINPIVDRLFAAEVTHGVSVLEYADKLRQIPETLIAAGLVVVVLPHWSGAWAEGNIEWLRRSLRQTTLLVTGALLPMLVAMHVAREFVVRLAFGRGAFDLAMVDDVAATLSAFLAGTIPAMLANLLAAMHLAVGQTRQVMLIGFVNAILNAALNALLLPRLGVPGVALSTAISACVTAALLYVLLARVLRRDNTSA